MERTECNICGEGHFEKAAEATKVRSNVRRWKGHFSTVWRCTHCNSLHSLEAVDLEKYYAEYPFKNRKLDFWTRIILTRYYRRIQSFGLNNKSRILDYGCGEGLFLDFLKEKGFTSLSGYDAYIDRYSNEDVLAHRYDVVILQDVIEHVEDPLALFKTLSSMLRERGILVIGTPSADQIDLTNVEEHIHSLHQPYHIHIFSEQALKGLGIENGLVLEQVARRHTVDTLFPFTNWTFMHAYLKSRDNCIDTTFEPPKMSQILTSPSLLSKGLFGYFFPIHSDLLCIYRKP